MQHDKILLHVTKQYNKQAIRFAIYFILSIVKTEEF